MLILLNLLVFAFPFTCTQKERMVICCSSNLSYLILMVVSLFSKFSVYRVGHRSLVLVVFIGGVTFAEIAALRFLSAQVRLV